MAAFTYYASLAPHLHMIVHGKVTLEAISEHPRLGSLIIEQQDSRRQETTDETQVRKMDGLRRTPGILRQPIGPMPNSVTIQGAFHFVAAAYLVAFISLKIAGLLHSLLAFPTMPAWFG